MEHHVFESNIDHKNCNDLFADETAGFAEHPAQMINTDGDDSLILLMEKMGVSDVDGFKISGRSSTASVLKNLVPYRVPDIVLHHSSHAVVEYNNPDLMPGMFPTLFPFGLGSFKQSLRVPKVSFQVHANALLDIPNKSFWR